MNEDYILQSGKGRRVKRKEERERGREKALERTRGRGGEREGEGIEGIEKRVMRRKDVFILSI